MCGDDCLCSESSAGSGRQGEHCVPGSVAATGQGCQWRLLQLTGHIMNHINRRVNVHLRKKSFFYTLQLHSFYAH